MERIGAYTQLDEFTTESAGTCEWCKAEKDGALYFIKKFHTPIYPSNDIDLPPKKAEARKRRFHMVMDAKKRLYDALRAQNSARTLVIPVDVLSYQFHIVTIAEYVKGNLDPSQVWKLSPWQRLVLMRLLTASLMSIHKAGVVHSDMKPDNILIIQDEAGNCTLKIIDFDGSFMADDPPESDDEVVGDPAYFAPEAYLMSQRPVRLDCRMDLFALGLILHYFWCGALPEKPKDQTIGECLLKHGRVILNPAVPLPLQKMIAGLLNPDPDKRLTAEAAYEILGAQLAQYERKIVKLKPEPEPEKRQVTESREKQKTAAVTVESRTLSGTLLRSRIVEIPYGSSKDFTAETFPGYKLVDIAAKRTITVAKNGHVESPVIFRYAQESATSPTVTAHPPRSRKWIIGLVITLFAAAALIIGIVASTGGCSGQSPAQPTTKTVSQYGSKVVRVENRAGTSQVLAGSIEPYKAVTVRITRAGDYLVYTFKPTKSGTYSFYSTNAPYPVQGWIYLSTNLLTPLKHVVSNNRNNFSISYYFTKGNTYYLVTALNDLSRTAQYYLYIN